MQLVRWFVLSRHVTKSRRFGVGFWKLMWSDQCWLPQAFEGCSIESMWAGRPKPLSKENTNTHPSAGIRGRGGAEPRPQSSGEESESWGHPPGFVYSGHTDSCRTKQERRKGRENAEFCRVSGTFPNSAFSEWETVLEQGFLNSTHTRTLVTWEYFIWLWADRTIKQERK